MRSLARWDPFDSLSLVEREARRLIPHMFTDPVFGWRTAGAWRPAVDVYREGNDFVLRAELPGIDPQEDLDVSVEGGLLRIKGHRSERREIKEEDRFLQERFTGAFERAVSLPEGSDVDALSAKYVDGVLTIRVPYIPEEIPESRHIPIEVEGETKLADKPAKGRVKKPKKAA